MKTLTITLKTRDDLFHDAIKTMKNAIKKEAKKNQHLITFTDPKEFDKLLRHLKIIRVIKCLEPESVYELAKAMNVNVSNLNKSIQFLEKFEIIKIKKVQKRGRVLKCPIFEYQDIRITMAA